MWSFYTSFALGINQNGGQGSKICTQVQMEVRAGKGDIFECHITSRRESQWPWITSWELDIWLGRPYGLSASPTYLKSAKTDSERPRYENLRKWQSNGSPGLLRVDWTLTLNERLPLGGTRQAGLAMQDDPHVKFKCQSIYLSRFNKRCWFV